MKSLLILTTVLFSSLVLAAAEDVIKCKVSNKDWTSTISVTEEGDGVLKFQKAGDERFYGCTMRLDSLTDGRGGMASSVVARFTLGDCDPDIYSYEKEVLKSITLIVKFSKGQVKEGRAQWLTKKQPDTCVVEKFETKEVSAFAKKSAVSSYGRRPASTSPKKIKKKF